MSKLPSAIKLYKGVSIYKVSGSPFWYVRVWDRKRKKYVVKSTGEESSLLARDAAQDLALDLLKREKVVEAEYTFKHFGLKMLNNMQREARLGNKSPGSVHHGQRCRAAGASPTMAIAWIWLATRHG